jgi:hypothetical protein
MGRRGEFDLQIISRMTGIEYTSSSFLVSPPPASGIRQRMIFSLLSKVKDWIRALAREHGVWIARIVNILKSAGHPKSMRDGSPEHQQQANIQTSEVTGRESRR